jgi:hypothetical protein
VWVCQLGHNAVTFHSQTHIKCLAVDNLCCHNIPSVSLILTLHFIPVSILMQMLCSFQCPNPKKGTDYPNTHNNNRISSVLIKFFGKFGQSVMI